MQHMIARLIFAFTCLFFASLSLYAEDVAEGTPEPEPPKVVQATATDEIVALVGKTATVEGKVTRVGATSGGGITFINMAPGANAFVAVVFKSSYDQFPNGFDAFKDQTLRVTGTVAIFKENTPQIVVKTADQIEIVKT